MVLGQRNLPHANQHLGNSVYYIHAKGCLITVLAECLGVSVEEVNNKLKSLPRVGEGERSYTGFAKDGAGQEAWVVWSRIKEAFPQIDIRRVWSYNNDDVIASLNAGARVVVEVDAGPIGQAGGKHWVRYVGDHKLHDPWTGTERPTSDFPNPSGYCVITGHFEEKKEEPKEEPKAEGQDIDEYSGLDLSNQESMKVAAQAWADVNKHGKYIKTDDVHNYLNRIAEAAGVEVTYDIDQLVERIKNNSVKSGEVTEATLQNLPEGEKQKVFAEFEEVKNRIRTLLDY